MFDAGFPSAQLGIVHLPDCFCVNSRCSAVSRKIHFSLLRSTWSLSLKWLLCATVRLVAMARFECSVCDAEPFFTESGLRRHTKRVSFIVPCATTLSG